MHVCAEIEYDESVHSDLCGDPSDPEWRILLHTALDEFLDHNCNGLFYVGDIATFIAGPLFLSEMEEE